jgi:putative peptidoglycan lipid II flippase
VAGWSLAAVVLNQIGFAVVQRAVTAAGAVGDNAGSAAYDRAFLIYIVPHSLVTVSLVTALFTRLSRAAANDDLPGVRADVSLGLRSTGVAMLLATAAFVALGPQITYSIFPGTRPELTEAIAHGAMALALGLVFFSAHYSFQRVFFAFDDGRTPFFLQLPVMVVTALGSVLALLLLPSSQVLIGVGLAISAANLAGSIVSAVVLRRRIGSFEERRIAGVYGRAGLGAAAAAAAGWLVATGVTGVLGGGWTANLVALLAGGAAVLAVYAGVLRLLRVSELSDAFAPVLRRLARR